MKKPRGVLVSLFLILLVNFLTSCGEDFVSKSCIEPPCGTIETSAMNLSLLVFGNALPTEILLSVDSEEVSLSLESLELERYACWQTIPVISSESTVYLNYTIDGEIQEATLDVTYISTNQVILAIGEEVTILNDFQECIDFI